MLSCIRDTHVDPVDLKADMRDPHEGPACDSPADELVAGGQSHGAQRVGIPQINLLIVLIGYQDKNRRKWRNDARKSDIIRT